METELGKWVSRYLRFGATVADPFSVVTVYYGLLIWTLRSLQNGDPVGYQVLLATTYSFLLVMVWQLVIGLNGYPWYLALKARRPSILQYYLFSKFRYRLARSIKGSLPKVEGGLFVRFRVLETAQSRRDSIKAEEVPDLQQLIRAFNQEFNAATFLKSGNQRADEIKSHINRLEANIRDSETFGEGYLRHVTDAFFDMSPAARSLVMTHREDTIWDRLERYPSTARLLFRVFLVILALITVFFVRVPLLSLL